MDASYPCFPVASEVTALLLRGQTVCNRRFRRFLSGGVERMSGGSSTEEETSGLDHGLLQFAVEE